MRRGSGRATSDEASRSLPGDDLIAQPIGSLTHAITIRRPPCDVWPWLAQMGPRPRAGWYSYDFLHNGQQPSAERIVPELQGLSVGMVFPSAARRQRRLQPRCIRARALSRPRLVVAKPHIADDVGVRPSRARPSSDTSRRACPRGPRLRIPSPSVVVG